MGVMQFGWTDRLFAAWRLGYRFGVGGSASDP